MKKMVVCIVLMLCMCVLISGTIPVEIVNNAEDSVGKKLVTKVRDVIRASPGYSLTYSTVDPHFKVRIDTMDRWKGDYEYEGVSTIYNYTILLYIGEGLDIYCYGRLGYAGVDTLNGVAEDIYSDLDEFIDDFARYINAYLEE